MEQLTNSEKFQNLKICKDCAENSNCYNFSCEEIYNALSKLARFEDLEEQDRLLEIPCKVGDIVFTVNETVKKINSYYVTDIRRDSSINDWYVLLGYNTIYHFSEFGKTIFVSKEKAEQTLERQ